VTATMIRTLLTLFIARPPAVGDADPTDDRPA
jgi:hypothetical protein